MRKKVFKSKTCRNTLRKGDIYRAIVTGKHDNFYCVQNLTCDYDAIDVWYTDGVHRHYDFTENNLGKIIKCINKYIRGDKSYESQ